MPRDLFGDVTRPSISIGNRKWYTLPVSLVSHSAIVLILIALPILAPSLTPEVFSAGTILTIVDLVPPSPPPLPRPAGPAPPASNPNAAPITAPDSIVPEPLLEAGFENTSNVPGIIDGNADPAVLTPPPAVKPTQPQAPIRVGSTIRTPMKVHNVDPVYPPIAQSARVQGIVILEATIAEDGHVINARILRSVPLLDQAALDAVRQWQFTPSLLNGVPVPVIMTVTVNFTLRR
jgi:protein TonB